MSPHKATSDLSIDSILLSWKINSKNIFRWLKSQGSLPMVVENNPYICFFHLQLIVIRPGRKRREVLDDDREYVFDPGAQELDQRRHLIQTWFLGPEFIWPDPEGFLTRIRILKKLGEWFWNCNITNFYKIENISNNYLYSISVCSERSTT